MYWSDGHPVWGALMMLLLLVPVIVLIVVLLRDPRGQRHGAGEVTSAQEILERRFARGEIDTEEFVERSRALHHPTG